MNNDLWNQYLSNIEDTFSVNQIFLNELQKKTCENGAEQSAATENNEGELAIDIYRETDRVIVVALIAGTAAKDVAINFHDGVLTIHGERKRPPMSGAANGLYQECYWGNFSRSIILPETINTDKIDAIIKNGLLIVVLPLLTNGSRKINITEVDE